MSEAATGMIEAEGLTKHFGATVAVDDVSFSIPRGQVVAFLGPNGAGKTTTMRMLTGYLTPTSGSARIAGFDVAGQRLDAARHIGYMPENGPLYPTMTPRTLLQFFGRARGLKEPRLQERIDSVTELCKIAPVLQKPIYKLSKGFRQRVGMAQALLHEPDVLILDEPTSGLDPNQIREVRIAIREIGRKRTILLSTHILQEVEAVADRVLLVHEGRIVFEGPPDEMKKDGPIEAFFHKMTTNGKDGA